MSKVAYIFPGQGSQYVGMGKDLFEQNKVARDLYKKANSVLGFELSKICFNGPEEILKRTENTQPAIFLHSVVLMNLLSRKNISMVAGHSLGEYSALVVAGAITFEDGLRLVRLRGKLMQEAGEREKGTMAAVVGLEPKVVEAVCTEAGSVGVVQCANFNSPGQIVISGSVDGVRKAMEIAKKKGARLVKELVVSGAFHSPLMRSASQGFQSALVKTVIHNSPIPFYPNVTGQCVQNAEEIRTLLNKQLTSPVRWEESIQQMIADGTTTFIEIGPGKVLQGLIKRINSVVEVKGVDKYEDVIKFNNV